MSSRLYPDDSPRVHRAKFYREGWTGWFGLGGSVMQWHSDLDIALGFTNSLLHVYDMSNIRSAKYQVNVLILVGANCTLFHFLV